jgi:KamA family protein
MGMDYRRDEIAGDVILSRYQVLNPPKFKAYSLHNYRQIPQYHYLTDEQVHAIEVVGRVLPFRTNSYVTNELIRWNNIPNDPIFILTFPQKDMLKPHHFDRIANMLAQGSSEDAITEAANEIRHELDPHPAGQLEHNRPTWKGQILKGMQHKYNETVLFFPTQGQTCHAFCSFCFRWPQFTGIDEFKIAMKDTELLINYIQGHPEISDILITGGDPLTMRTKVLAHYIEALLDADISHLTNIRLGSKALAYWPNRFTSDNDADDLLGLFDRVASKGKHLALMAHFNHPREMETKAVKLAIQRLKQAGVQIRTQSPLLTHINDDPDLWARMWREQVRLGCIPYYMFIVRDTGAQHYFGMPLERAYHIFQKAYQQVSGLARTVRGPSMSCHPGKVQVAGIQELNDEKVFVLKALQARNADLVMRPFFAQYNPDAMWFDDLQPAFGEDSWFFEE